MKPEASSSIITREIDGKIFLARRSFKKQSFPGEWEMIGGGIEANETAEDCIKREIKEELRCNVIFLEFFKDYDFTGKKFHVFEIKLGTEPSPNKDDFEEWGWFEESSIRGMKFVLNCKERLLDFFESQKKSLLMQE